MNATRSIATPPSENWQAECLQAMPQNFETFRSLVGRARDLAAAGKYHLAVVYCEMAANYASCQACGLWFSPEIEGILLEIGQKAVWNRIERRVRQPLAQKTPQKILHVATAMADIGGHSRMLWRWLQQDPDRTHSLAITRQARQPVPQALVTAVAERGGEIYQLDCRPGNLLDRARRLAEIAADADLIVLHVNSADAIPLLAFANQERLPPICFLDHADHLFWLGASISDAVINLRESGMKLAQTHRGIDPLRNFLLPIILAPTHRQLSREAAKQQLGIPTDSVLLLSIARGVKFKTVDLLDFAAAHVALLQQYPQAILTVVGAGNREDWAEAIASTQGRIMVLGETPNTAVFYQAADIYVDSIPVGSNTSLLEAGSYGIPAISGYPYLLAPDAILGADMPGLLDRLIRVRTLPEYERNLAKLITDPQFRQSLGAATQNQIAAAHWGEGWQQLLERMYADILELPKLSANMNFAAKNLADKMGSGDPDCLLHHIHVMDISKDKLTQWHLPFMPFPDRVSQWLKLTKKLGSSDNPLNLLLSDWQRALYFGWKDKFRKSVKRI